MGPLILMIVFGLAAVLIGIGVLVWIRSVTSDPARLAASDPEKFIRSVSLFGALGDAEVNEIRGSLDRLEFAHGATIFREGDKGSVMFIVAGGAVRIIKFENGQAHLLKIARPGDLIGEMALLSGLPRTATAVCEGPTVVYALDRAKIDAIKGKSQQIVDTMWGSYSWNVLDNYLRSGAHWRVKLSRPELQQWFARQMSFSAGMDERLPVPNGAGMVFVVTGRISISGNDVSAPGLAGVLPDAQVTALRSSRVIWLMSHPKLIPR